MRMGSLKKKKPYLSWGEGLCFFQIKELHFIFSSHRLFSLSGELKHHGPIDLFILSRLKQIYIYKLELCLIFTDLILSLNLNHVWGGLIRLLLRKMRQLTKVCRLCFESLLCGLLNYVRVWESVRECESLLCVFPPSLRIVILWLQTVCLGTVVCIVWSQRQQKNKKTMEMKVGFVSVSLMDSTITSVYVQAVTVGVLAFLRYLFCFYTLELYTILVFNTWFSSYRAWCPWICVLVSSCFRLIATLLEGDLKVRKTHVW